jgi:hypothetical protein
MMKRLCVVLAEVCLSVVPSLSWQITAFHGTMKAQAISRFFPQAMACSHYRVVRTTSCPTTVRKTAVVFHRQQQLKQNAPLFVVFPGRFGIDIYAQDENNDNAWRWFGTSGGAAQRANSHESFLGLRPLPGNKPRKYTVYFPTHIPVTSLQIGATPLLLLLRLA